MIKKCSSDRLRSKLVEAGYDSATVSKLDSTGLMEAMAQLMMKQSVSGLDSDATTQGDMASEIRLRELALEEKRIEAEQEQRRELRKMELELKMIEEKRLEREAEQMRLEREAEQKRLEREAEAEQKRLEREAEYRREQMKLELDMKRLELEGTRAGWYEQREDEGAGYDEEALGPGERGHALDRRTKHFGDTLRHVCRLCRLRFRNFLNFSIRSKSFIKFTRCRTISELNCSYRSCHLELRVLLWE